MTDNKKLKDLQCTEIKITVTAQIEGGSRLHILLVKMILEEQLMILWEDLAEKMMLVEKVKIFQAAK